MESLVLETETLPKALAGRIHSKKFKAMDSGESITLIPLPDSSTPRSRLFGMLKGKISVDDFLKQKQADKELEL